MRLARGGRIEANMEPLVSANHAPSIYRTNISGFAEAYIFRGLITPMESQHRNRAIEGHTHRKIQ
jgi:hypothetical protein